MNILIVKHGALGDVVRTSYFAEALRAKWGAALRLSWITAPASAPLLRFNPHIDDLWTSFEHARSHYFDHIFSLDDERDVLEGVAKLDAAKITGALLRAGQPGYTDDAAPWFDMGLLSRFGKARADEMKRLNRRGHAEIFAELFCVSEVRPGFHGNPRLEQWASDLLAPHGCVVGINPFAGGRWSSKELRQPELETLIDRLLASDTPLGRNLTVMLIGAGADRERNLQLAAARAGQPLVVPDTDESVLRLAAVIRRLDVLITSDSLAMHLAIAQGVPTLAFFAPTSAAEIDDFGLIEKVISTSSDYCSYRKDADNSSIASERLLRALDTLVARTRPR